MRTEAEILDDWRSVASLPDQVHDERIVDTVAEEMLVVRVQSREQALAEELGTEFDQSKFAKIGTLRFVGQMHGPAYAEILDEVSQRSGFEEFACSLIGQAVNGLGSMITTRFIERLAVAGKFTSIRKIIELLDRRDAFGLYLDLKTLSEASRDPADLEVFRQAARSSIMQRDIITKARAWQDVFALSRTNDDLLEARAATSAIPHPRARAMHYADLGAITADPADFAVAFKAFSEAGKPDTLNVLMLIDKVVAAAKIIQVRTPDSVEKLEQLIGTMPNQRWRDNALRLIRSSDQTA